jgi:hypothetical protein
MCIVKWCYKWRWWWVNDLIADVDSDENQVDIDYKIKEELNKTLSVLDDREKKIRKLFWY